MTTYRPHDLAASDRAARLVANLRALTPDWYRPLADARKEGEAALAHMTMALAVLYVSLADDYHRDRAQAALDAHAINAGGFMDDQLKRNAETSDD